MAPLPCASDLLSESALDQALQYSPDCAEGYPAYEEVGIKHPVHIQPTRVRRTRPICVTTSVKLPPFQQPTALAAEAQQQQQQDIKVQPRTPGLVHPSPSPLEKVMLASRVSLPQSDRLPTPAYCPSAGALVLGVRVCITTCQGPRTGKVVDVQGNGGKHLVRFDEGACEWLSLPNSSWRFHTPRAVSAGLTPALCQAMRKLGAANLLPEPQPPMAPPGARLGPTPASAAAAVGQQLYLWCAAAGRWHAGLVVALSQAGTGLHHVVYADGADEWVNLPKEVVLWAAPTQGQQSRARHICPSLPAAPAPRREAAINWRIGLYWTGDQSLFEGTVTGFEGGQHEVSYDDGDVEMVRLDDQDLVIWRCMAVEEAEPEAEEEEGEREGREGVDDSGGAVRSRGAEVVVLGPHKGQHTSWENVRPMLSRADSSEACRAGLANSGALALRCA